MRMLPLLAIVIIGYILWKLVKVARMMRNSNDNPENQNAQARVDFPSDQSYKNIEDADFEDISRDPDKTP